MDNITHTLIGLASGEFIFQNRALFSKDCKKITRPLILATSVLGNNLPDIDLIYVKLDPGPLTYLLQHRGFTHTLLGIIPQTLVVLIFLWFASKFRKSEKFSWSDWGLVTLTVGLGILTHIFADSWNSYGVHPFWPFNNRWFYGDSVFIAEPWIWITLIPPLYLMTKNNITRFVYILFLGGFLTGAIWNHWVPAGIVFAMFLWTPLWFILVSQTQESRRALYALLMLAALIGLFGSMEFYVRLHVQEMAWEKDPEAKPLDTVLSPMPGNFFCWRVISVKLLGDSNSSYKIQGGYFSVWPGYLSPKECSEFGLKRGAQTTPIKNNNDDLRIFWSSPFKMPLQKFESIYKKDCRFRAYLKFARVPFFIEKKQSIAFGDYRFSNPDNSNFSKLEFPKTITESDCQKYSPPWDPPRADLIKLMQKP